MDKKNHSGESDIGKYKHLTLSLVFMELSYLKEERKNEFVRDSVRGGGMLLII